MTTLLLEEAKYGAIPFDLFALDNWDHSLPTNDDGRQWNSLVQKYLSLPELDRFPWHQWGGLNLPHPLLVPDNIDRVLRPHQTAQERNMSANAAPVCGHFVWLRTCYDPELQSQYDELLSASGADEDLSICYEWILDDATLYNFGSDWNEIVTRTIQRMPSLCDPNWASVEEDYQYRIEDDETGDESELEKASNRVRSALFVIDEGAIKDQMIKIFWLGAHGKCLWHNEMRPNELGELSGTFRGSYTLWESVGQFFEEGEKG